MSRQEFIVKTLNKDSSIKSLLEGVCQWKQRCEDLLFLKILHRASPKRGIGGNARLNFILPPFQNI